MVEWTHRGVTGVEKPHTCGRSCLGPLAFHTGALGDSITLTHGARRAERAGETFRHGLVFSDRPVRVGEKVLLRVERSVQHWHGALRLGLTSVPPACGPQADLAIPNLTATPGYWAAPVPEDRALPGSRLRFWVTRDGRLAYSGRDGRKHWLLGGLDLSRPLWAMIDVYGQTCAVALLGSEKKSLFGVRRSCPGPALPPAPYCPCAASTGTCVSQKPRFCPPSPVPSDDAQDRSPSSVSCSEYFDPVKDCAVCMSRAACVTLCCGHRCLCAPCANRVNVDFGTCPLCRQPIT